MTLKISTPENIHAEFFMKGETADGINDFPRIAPHQVHGKNILVIDSSDFPESPEADGVLLKVPDIGASLRFADCAPVLLWGKDWAMILHSGYKGTVLNISREGLNLVDGALGAWIGPCIGSEHYCRDLADDWTQMGMKSFHRENWRREGEKIYFDLAGEIRDQLSDCGVSAIVSGINTFRDDRCYSYRRGDKTERMTLYVRTKKITSSS